LTSLSTHAEGVAARRREPPRAETGDYWATTAVPANWQRLTPAIEYSSARNATLTELDPVGER
jgi:hypothetical protein